MKTATINLRTGVCWKSINGYQWLISMVDMKSDWHTHTHMSDATHWTNETQIVKGSASAKHTEQTLTSSSRPEECRLPVLPQSASPDLQRFMTAVQTKCCWILPRQSTDCERSIEHKPWDGSGNPPKSSGESSLSFTFLIWEVGAPPCRHRQLASSCPSAELPCNTEYVKCDQSYHSGITKPSKDPSLGYWCK